MPSTTPPENDPHVIDDVLAQLRVRIDELDAALITLMKNRFEVTRKVGAHKRAVGLPPADPSREQRQIARLRAMAAEADLDPAFSEKLLRLIIDEVIRDYARADD
ncbi:MAG TPA: chorismate mutase [Euzebya sp.]|nr:chorismate mutase [Euzebya sp.]